MFGIVYAATRNLALVIGIHAAWNTLQGPIFGSVVSGATADSPSVLLSHPHGPVLLSGGGFGIEASLVTVVVITCFTIACARWLHRSGRVIAPAAQRRARALVPRPHVPLDA
ncbi:hypothetical protein ACQB6R_10390 [Propionibacteriaceae bacterium G1746]|uniref:hypothetical protein n=1 Tax=Aestuariimicrobium sp. G57 TaxID=3418485 RepID=UPI003C1D3CB1